MESKRKKINRKKTDACSVRDKNRQLMLKVEETIKLITNGRLTYTDISQKNGTKVTLTDIYTDCILKPRFHTSALEYLLTNHCFHANALEFAENMLANLKSKRKKVKKEWNKNDELRIRKNRAFLGYFKQTKFASAQGDTSSGSNGVSGQLGSIDNSDVSELYSESSTDTECYLSSDVESD